MPRSPDYDDKRDESGLVRGPGPFGVPTLEPNEARQGAPHHNVRLVLAISTATVVVAFILIYLAYFG
jgi:hypothetical protein